VAFVAVRLGVVAWARPHYESAVSKTWCAATSGPNLRTAWVLNQGQTDAHGHALHNATAIALGLLAFAVWWTRHRVS
jgi:hypothetical protein